MMEDITDTSPSQTITSVEEACYDAFIDCIASIIGELLEDKSIDNAPR
jgi:hypothetical protein